MKRKDVERYADPEELKQASAAGLGMPGMPGMPEHEHGPTSSVRTADYLGHTITIRTTYEVEIDGTRIAVPFHVGDDGQVTCHAVPAYSSPTALDVARRIIDAYPHKFPGRK
jgi:hypothetical protein